MRRAARRLALAVLAALAILLLGGCRTLGYYAHVGHGQLALMAQREPIAEVIADPATDPALRERLGELRDARAFASERLGLPRNGSYTAYVALPGPYVTWNVFAAPEFSVEPLTHCFPIAGCVAYRGYFDADRARREAARLRGRGYQTYVGGVAAYSTLGWFDDPVLSSMLAPGQDDPVGVMFHELAHQWLYLRDDTAFNESLASFVQRQGLREWRAARGKSPPDPALDAHERAFVSHALALRDTLAAIYRRPLTHEAMRAERDTAIAGFRAWHAQVRRERWPDDARFDRWVAEPINNAKLVPLGLYDRWVPAFSALFQQSGGDWQRFEASVRAIAAQPRATRSASLEALLPPGSAD
ncbi:aminopeptidase [Marilutibacter maris]|uniref:Putative aminopeptidase n=1 Tax=Marilutibacter maris TaxID=1605891 RepID=A0A2U9T969_9GAMM|nr:aminopeptidase [Lysobacter maris]AWV07098.1 putative aminopeptidase [Lysobacter maris]